VKLTTPSQSSLWDRISKWASENKVAVYTIAGVAIVVTGAGVAYYLRDSVRLNNVFYLAIRPC
jgi:mitochondrial import receptor subunit TOM70